MQILGPFLKISLHVERINAKKVPNSARILTNCDFLDNKLLSGKNQTSFYSEALKHIAKVTIEPGNSGVGLIPIFIIFDGRCYETMVTIALKLNDLILNTDDFRWIEATEHQCIRRRQPLVFWRCC